MSFLRRIEIPIILFAIGSLLPLIDYYTGNLSVQASELLSWVVILVTFSYLIGVVNLFRYHLNNIRKGRDVYYSVLVIGSFLFYLAIAYLNKSIYDWIFSKLYTPLSMSISSFVGFYTYTVFLRGARLKSPTAILLLIVTVVILLYNTPSIRALSPQLITVGDWIKNVPNTGAYRGILIGMGISMIVLFMRAIIGRERSYLGGG